MQQEYTEVMDISNILGSEEINGRYYPFNLVKPISISWSNKNRGLNLELLEGSKTITTIWATRNDGQGPDLRTLDHDAITEAIDKLQKANYETKRFELCPGNEIQIWTSQNITVRFLNTEEKFLGILTKGRIGHYTIQ